MRDIRDIPPAPRVEPILVARRDRNRMLRRDRNAHIGVHIWFYLRQRRLLAMAVLASSSNLVFPSTVSSPCRR